MPKLIGYWTERKMAWEKDKVDPYIQPSEVGFMPTNLVPVVATYLEAGSDVIQYRGYSGCRMCGQTNGSREKSDGIWIWPQGLAHYVREHLVNLPTEFIEHVCENVVTQLGPPKIPYNNETEKLMDESKDETFWRAWCAQFRRKG